MIAKRTKPKRGAKAFRIAPRADIRNTLSNRFSVIEVEGLDRPGLLSEITGALSDLSLDIASAHITTFGEKVIDTFYVTDLTGAEDREPDAPGIGKHHRHARRRSCSNEAASCASAMPSGIKARRAKPQRCHAAHRLPQSPKAGPDA